MELSGFVVLLYYAVVQYQVGIKSHHPVEIDLFLYYCIQSALVQSVWMDSSRYYAAPPSTIIVSGSGGETITMVDQSSGNGNGKRRRRGRKSESEPPSSSSSSTFKTSSPAGGVASVKNNSNNKTSETPYQPHSALLIQWDSGDTEPWYKYGQSLPDRDAVVVAPSLKAEKGDPTKQQQQPSPYSAPPSLQLVQKYRSLADAVYRREVQLFSQHNGSSSSGNKDDRWVESTMRQGTLKDRVAAMSVVVSSHPVHKFYALDGLLQMAGCGTDSSSVNLMQWTAPTVNTNKNHHHHHYHQMTTTK